MPEYSFKTNGLTLNYFCNDVEAKKTLVLYEYSGISLQIFSLVVLDLS
jgi:hypothetical protein